MDNKKLEGIIHDPTVRQMHCLRRDDEVLPMEKSILPSSEAELALFAWDYVPDITFVRSTYMDKNFDVTAVIVTDTQYIFVSDWGVRMWFAVNIEGVTSVRVLHNANAHDSYIRRHYTCELHLTERFGKTDSYKTIPIFFTKELVTKFLTDQQHLKPMRVALAEFIL